MTARFGSTTAGRQDRAGPRFLSETRRLVFHRCQRSRVAEVPGDKGGYLQPELIPYIINEHSLWFGAAARAWGRPTRCRLFFFPHPHGPGRPFQETTGFAYPAHHR